MNHMTKIFLIPLLALLVASCSRMSEEDAFTQAKAAIDKKKTDDALKFLEIVYKDHPSGKHAPDALFLAASLYQNEKKNLDKALELYAAIDKDYAESAVAPRALFTSAFICANQKNDFEKAKARYKEFIKRYPKHELAASAQSEIDNMGVDPNVLLENLQQRQNATAESPQGK